MATSGADSADRTTVAGSFDLNTAISLAALAHRGQRDKLGQPYILHPLRVMLRLTAQDEMVCAVLHDVVEDTTTSLADLLAMGLKPEIGRALDHLTKRPEEKGRYMDFIRRVEGDPLAVAVKLADLEDNMDRRRLPSPLPPAFVNRLRAYREAHAHLARVGTVRRP
ncbi:MAG TPA: GTP pyrophosphokinase [Bacillota bacterium]|jgi:(p)ppGpp synthase/HD superfamily hydrolase